MSCDRSITFNIFNKHGKPVLEITATEVNGSIVFEVEVVGRGHKADLRALFFNLNDDSKMAGLSVLNTDSTVSDFQTGDLIDMGNGANLQGVASPFDVGLEFGTAGVGKDVIGSSVFTLSNTANNLTLDDIAHVQFGTKIDGISGPSKSVWVAPAAPDAQDDSYNIFEDGQAGLDSPSKTSDGVIFQVLDNDTDADGDTLTITEVSGALHGTLEIVDGDDADLLPGDAVLYTPFLDYSGADSFTYCISDNNGGQDSAEVTVSVEAVADVPLLSYEVAAGANVNEIIVTVTATQNDADGSEFIDRIDLSGLPSGVTATPLSADPIGQPGQVVQQFLITVPLDQDTNFDLGISAYSEEMSNGDQQVATTTLPIAFDYTHNTFQQTYHATDQSIWDTGDQFTFTDNRFLGLDTSWDESSGGFLYGETNGHIKAGFQSTLSFEGGEIDATVPYDITIDTNYNKTTDVMVIGGSSFLDPAAFFTTEGPEGSYMLDFIFSFFLHAAAGVDAGVDSFDIFSVDLGPVDESFNILDLQSDDLNFTVELPAGFSLNFAWTNVDTSSTPSGGGTFESSGESNNFFELGLDLDDLIFTILGLPNPFDIGFDVGVADGSIQILDVDLSAGLNFIQNFAMNVSELVGFITFENGSTQAFDFNSDITLVNASSYDADQDGSVEFELTLAPSATLENNTDLGVNVGASLDVLKLDGSYDIVVDSGELHLGPLFHVGGSANVATFDLYDKNFALNFQSQDINFLA